MIGKLDEHHTVFMRLW